VPPTKTDWGFKGWYTDKALTQSYDFSAPVTREFTLYTKWVTPFVRVSFDSSGGSAVSAQVIAVGGRAVSPPDPTKAGYVFGGWYKNVSFTLVYDFIAPVGEVAFTLYAKWMAVYTVTFDLAGGNIVTTNLTQTVTDGGRYPCQAILQPKMAPSSVAGTRR
jgi:uncharacterized repeat protein (TIGR02543 family)